MLSFRPARLKLELAELPVLLLAPMAEASDAGGGVFRGRDTPYGVSASMEGDAPVGYGSGSLNIFPVLMFARCVRCRAGDLGGGTGVLVDIVCAGVVGSSGGTDGDGRVLNSILLRSKLVCACSMAGASDDLRGGKLSR